MNKQIYKNNKTGYKGVFLQNGKFRAAVHLKGAHIYIGMYLTAIQAAKAYNEKAKELFGEFACLNAIEEGSSCDA